MKYYKERYEQLNKYEGTAPIENLLTSVLNKEGIEIEITGLRPGEKLYEELLSTKENTIPTEHAKIMRAKVRRYTEEEVNEKIEIVREGEVASLIKEDFKGDIR